MSCSSHATSDCPSSDLTLRCHIVMDTLDASLDYFSYKRYHGVVSHDKRFLRFCVFRDGVQSFDPIIDRSRDLSHAVVRKFCPNPRICMQKWPKRQSHLSWDPSANSADSCDICQRLALLHFSSQPSSNVPCFTKILLESRLAFVQRLSWSCPVCTRKEHSSCFPHSPLITTRMAGSVSWVWNSTGEKKGCFLVAPTADILDVFLS
jgi:hypothetical protein